MNKSKGITLIALIITIIILLILAGVSIVTMTEQDGIFAKAQNAVEQTNQKSLKEQIDLAIVGAKMQKNYQYNKDDAKIEIEKIQGVGITDNQDGALTVKKDGIVVNVDKDGNTRIVGQTEILKDTEPTKSYVGYYADIDGNESVDGIIFADLITGVTGADNMWGDYWGYYIIDTIKRENSKNYYISQESYTDKFGTMPVIAPVKGTAGKDRFYVMSLNDFNNENGPRYCWYDAACDDGGRLDKIESYVTDLKIGTGKTNTEYMITKWDNDEYGATDDNGYYKDVWGQIKTEVSKGWFLPSRAEWSAFGGEIADKLNIMTSNYSDFGFGNCYLSSSQNDLNEVFRARFERCYIGPISTAGFEFVRLASTF